ncbi:MAG TPA: hypothetical protein VGM39_21205 [Kofleriaceae bacterium]
MQHYMVLAACAAAVAGCSNKKEINSAKASVYDTDFAIVYSAALDATREQYHNLDDNPRSGMIKTAWHQVTVANEQDDVAQSNTQTMSTSSMGSTSPAASAAGMPTRLAYKRTFIRFEVSVVGGRPWRVKVVGHAADWDPGNAMPTELHGIARPPWLEGRIESLQVQIYRRIKAYAKPAPPEVLQEKNEPDLPTTDPKTFSHVPDGAAKVLASVKDALARRDIPMLRAMLADDVAWSMGADGNADTAMAMWQADAESLDSMGKVIASGCGVVMGKVACPVATPKAGQFQLLLAPAGPTWKVVSFLRAE